MKARKRIVSLAVALAFLAAHGYSVESVPVQNPKPGTVRTSNGKVVDVTTKDGCFWLSNPQLGRTGNGWDPTDGAVFCER